MESSQSKKPMSSDDKKRMIAIEQNSNEIQIVLSAKFEILHFNKVAERLYQKKANLVLNKKYFDFFKKQHHKHFSLHQLSKVTVRKPLKFTSIILNKNNREHIVEWTILLNKINNTKEEYFLLGHDITKISLSNLKTKEKFLNTEIAFRDIITSLPGNIYWKDRKHRYLGCNQNILKLLHLNSVDEFIGKKPEDLVEEKTSLMLRRNDDSIMQSGVGVHFEEKAFAPDGSEAIYLTSKVPLKNSERKVIGMAGISFDITDRKKMEQELCEAKKRAEAANKAKSEFLATVSHELRIPLTGVLGMAQLLQEENLTSSQNKKVEDIFKAGQHLLALVNDLLDLSKLEAGKFELQLAQIDLRKLIEEVATMLIFQCKAKGLNLNVHYEKDVPAFIMGDARVLRQIVLNLVGNSIKFTEEGHIDITVECLEKNEKEAVFNIIVSDTGIGIPAEKLEAIFERFGQVDSSFEKSQGGVGLGLTITKSFIKLMDGELRVKSELGKGSQFICQIPVMLPNEVFQNCPWEDYRSKVRILIVDDSAQGEILAKHIASPYCEVRTSKQAIPYYLSCQQTHEAIDIIIVDDKIKSVTPLEIIQSLRISPIRNMPPLAILLSSSPTLMSKQNALTMGFENVFLKPLYPNDLLINLTAAWERWGDKFNQISFMKKTEADHLLNCRVLLVEDDLIVQRAHLMMLEKIGCSVEIAATGQEAIKKFKEANYDLVLMDVGLPKMNGIQVTKSLRQLEKQDEHTQIVGVTGYGHQHDIDNFLEHGMDEVLVKPVLLAQLKLLITRWVEKKQEATKK